MSLWKYNDVKSQDQKQSWKSGCRTENVFENQGDNNW